MRRRLVNLAKYSSYGLLTASFVAACGKDEGGVAEVKVTNGLEIDHSEYPSVVLLLLNGQGICTGTFVNDAQLITAAHCVDQLDPYYPDVRLVEPVHGNGDIRYRVRARAVSFSRNELYSIKENNGVNGGDLAIINFPRHTAPGVRSISPSSPEVDQQITIVGFGNNRNYIDPMGQQTGGVQVPSESDTTSLDSKKMA